MTDAPRDREQRYGDIRGWSRERVLDQLSYLVRHKHFGASTCEVAAAMLRDDAAMIHAWELFAGILCEKLTPEGEACWSWGRRPGLGDEEWEFIFCDPWPDAPGEFVSGFGPTFPAAMLAASERLATREQELREEREADE